MDIFQIVGLGITSVLLCLILKEQHSQFGLFVVLAFGVLVFLTLLDKVTVILRLFEDMSVKAGINLIYISTIFKIIGIAYVAEFSAQVCRDAGSGAVAAKIEFAAKIIMMTLAIPILAAILDAIIQLIP